MPDVVVIGGGIAGISVAAELADRAEVILLEQESALAYHTTGRSAALYFESYGSDASRPMSRASKPFLLDPPPDLVDGPLLSPRGALYVATEDQLDTLEETAEADAIGEFERLTDLEVMAVQPNMRPGYAVAGLLDGAAMDIDVAGLHQAYVRMFRARGGRLDTSAPVVGIERQAQGWAVTTAGRTLSADVVINASGAWGDVVAALAGVSPVGLTPMRRTAFMVAGDPALSDGPLVAGMDVEFYFKPDGEQVLCSLAEEEPEEPCDARPREIDVAMAIDRINTATTMDIRHVRSSWAGHRTFAPDDAPVTGFDPDAEGFFWLVGQGGTGIQTAPAAARYATGMILEGEPPADLSAENVDVALLAPDRFRS